MIEYNIAFCGNAQAGKTTCAGYLEDNYGFSVLSLSDKLKLNLIDIGVDPEHVFGRKTMWSRALMQVYGDYMRQEDPNYFIHHLMLSYDKAEEFNAEGVCVDDLRYINEWDALRKMGFVLVLVEKNGQESDDPHPTENEWKDLEPDFVISADEGDLKAMYEEVDKIIAEMEKM